MSINETLKQKIDELDLDNRIGELTTQAERGLNTALDKIGAFAGERQDEIASWLDKAEATVDSRTDGKYAEQVTKVKATITAGIGKLAQRAPSQRDDQAWTDETDSL